MNKSGITILLADDHPLLRDALRNVLEKQVDFKIIAEASNGEEAVRLTSEFRPDVVIMDISMPRLSGLEATLQIRKNCPGTAVLVLTVYDDIEHILAILECGAAGYLTKSVFGDEVVQAIRGIAAGESVLTHDVLENIMKHTIRHLPNTISKELDVKLTSRELDIIKMAARGISNKEIAEKFDIGTRTVKSHLEQVFSKLNAVSRTEAVIIALRTGIFTLDELELS
jgi:DNA-binding NarL/FixJ family response regulator